MDIDKLLEQELEKHPELKQLFEKHPEKKELYKQKILDSWDEKTGFTKTELKEKAKYCKTCMFSHGKPPFADLPEKCHCMIFEYPNDKPNEVYYDGKPCEYYEKQTLEERYKNEIFTDNTKIPKYEQCKDCKFRKMKIGASMIDDYRRSCCMIFEYPQMKPIQFYDGSAKCEYYEK